MNIDFKKLMKDFRFALRGNRCSTQQAYYNAALPGGDGFKRSVCVDELKFNPDGSIPVVQPT